MSDNIRTAKDLYNEFLQEEGMPPEGFLKTEFNKQVKRIFYYGLAKMAEWEKNDIHLIENQDQQVQALIDLEFEINGVLGDRFTESYN